MAGFAPTMWKTAQLPNVVNVRGRHRDDRAINVPEFSKQRLGPPQETQPSGSNDARCCNQQRAHFFE